MTNHPQRSARRQDIGAEYVALIIVGPALGDAGGPTLLAPGCQEIPRRGPAPTNSAEGGTSRPRVSVKAGTFGR